MTRRLALVVLATCAGFGLTACGGDDAGGSPRAVTDGTPAGAGLTLVAEDIRFSEETYRAAAGAVALSYRNDGRLPHTLVIEGVPGFKLDVSGKGDVDRGSVNLEPGEYTIYCDVTGHRRAGMEATLRVG